MKVLTDLERRCNTIPSLRWYYLPDYYIDWEWILYADPKYDEEYGNDSRLRRGM